MSIAKKGLLAIEIHEGRNLAIADIGGSSDPFVVISLLDANRKAIDTSLPQYRTTVIKKTLNPKWENQIGEFNPMVEGKVRVININCFDEDLMSDDFLGYFQIDPDDLPDGFVVEKWYKLLPRTSKDKTVSGELRVSAVYCRNHTKVEPAKPPVGGASRPAASAAPAKSAAGPGAVKQKSLDIEQTNIANLGSELEKRVRLEAASNEPAWKHAGQKPGLEIWRVEKFNVKLWPVAEHGNFFSGDSYIVLHTYKKNKDTEALAWDIHFWLGEFTTQDEAGTAAYKTVELDDFLGGGPIQHREIQGYESDLFLSYFNNTIHILEGGIDSGFKHVKPDEYNPRLLHIKGRKNVRVIQVPLAAKMLNSGDVFILDAGLTLYQWQGRQAGPAERIKAAQAVRAIADDRHGKSHVTVLDEASDDNNPEFWTILGGRQPPATAKEGGDDKQFEDSIAAVRQLYRLSDASGKLLFEKVAQGRIARNMLNSNDVFIFDTGSHVYAWVGSRASVAEKSKSLQYAQQYVSDHNRPVYLPISRILDGGSNRFFELSFDD